MFEVDYSHPFMIYWCDPETKKMTQIIIRVDKEANEAIVSQTSPDSLNIDDECMNKIHEGLVKEGFDKDIIIKINKL